MGEVKFEDINSMVSRLPVPGGWMYVYFSPMYETATATACFVPDENAPKVVRDAAPTAPEPEPAANVETWWNRVFRVVHEANCAEGNSSAAGREVGSLLVNRVELTVCARGRPHAYDKRGRLVMVADSSGWRIDGPWVAELERDIDTLEASIPALRTARTAKLAAEKAKADAELVAEIMEARKRLEVPRG